MAFVDGVAFHNSGGTGLEVLSGFQIGSGPGAENVRTFGALSSDPEFESAPVVCDKGLRARVYAAPFTFPRVR